MAIYNVNDGETSTGITLYYGSMYVHSGGTANKTTVDDSGLLYISSGGTAVGTTVSTYGHLYVSGGGTANSTTVNYDGWLELGGTANSTTINSGGYLYILSGGTATGITVNSNSYLFLSSGCTATNIVVCQDVGLRLTVAPDTYIQGESSGSAFLMENAFISEYTVNSYGKLYISSGGTANSIVVDSSGLLHIASGGTATNITAANGAHLEIAVAPDTYIQGTSAGSAFLMENASISGYTVNSNGSLYVSSGGTADCTTINSNGYLYVSSGGTANSTTVNSSGHMFVLSGGTANSVAVNSVGQLGVSSGGTALNVLWTPCVGYVSVDKDATVTYASNYSGVYFGATNTLLSSAMTMNSKVLSLSYYKMYVMSGGVATSTNVSNGYMYISSGGTASRTAVHTFGDLYIFSGGSANSTTVTNGGTLKIFSGGTATNIVASSGTFVDFTVAPDTYIQGTVGGYAFLISGATISGGTVCESCHHIIVSSGGTANSVTLTEGGMYVSSGGTANNITVSFSRYGGYFYVNSGGMANNVLISSGGRVSVSSGGTATNIIAEGGARLTITVASDTYIQGTSAGSAFLMENACISGYTVNSDGSANVQSDGTANDITVNSGGYLGVSSGGTANDITVNSSGRLEVRGTADDIAVNSGGSLQIFEGGTATSIVENGGYVSIGEGADVTFTPNSFSGLSLKGGATVHSGTTANNTTVNSGSYLTVYNGGTANSTTVNSGGSLQIFEGGMATSIVENGGYVSIGEGADVTFTPNSFSGLVLSSWQSATIHSGTTANSTIVSSGGRMYVYSCGKHAGALQVMEGARVIAANGSILDFTVAGRTTQDSYLINDLSLISGAPTYTITVAADQTGGTYKLAQGAEAFSRTISIGTNEIHYGSITVNGDALTYDHYTYTLTSSGGNLLLTVDDLPVVEDLDLTDSSYDVLSGSTVNSTTVNSGGSLVVSEGGTASSTTLNSGGSLVVSEGGAADGATVNSNGKLVVSSGGTAVNIVENGGYVEVVPGGADVTFTEHTISGLVLSASQSATVHSGTTANSTTISGAGEDSASLDVFGGTVNSTTVGSGGCLQIFEGGTANSTTVNAGGLYLFEGGTAALNTLNSGGSLVVSEGGTANSTTVNAGGTMHISSDGKHTGSLQIASGAVVSAYEGSIIDFTVSEMSPADSYQINNLSLIDGAPSYTITVEPNQGEGLYKLAQGAADFNGTITIGTDESVLGSITVNGSWLIGGSRTYHLVESDGSLILLVSADLTPPTVQVAASTTAPTNQPVILTATAADNVGVSSIEYSLNGEDWSVCSGTVSVDSNKTVYFRVTDTSGNVSDIAEYAVTNIDTAAPEAPTVLATPTAVTKQKVTLTATYSNDTVTRQYSTDNQTWLDYTDAITVTTNGTYYFRGIDEAGNISEVTSYEVTNIDKAAPDKPEVTASTTAATNKNITLTATFSADSVKKQYSLDNATWRTYSSSVAVAANGIYYFRGIDAVGNISEIAVYNVTNIDKTAPSIPTAKANITAVTNKDVTVTAAFSADSVTKQYSLDNSTWKSYTKGVVMSANGTVYFRGIDAAGNISKVAYLKVRNIDKAAPAKPTVAASTTAATNKNITLTATFSSDSSKKQYSTDNATWKTYSSAVAVAANGTYYFRGIDTAGNISAVKSYTVKNIDKTAPSKPTVSASTTAATNKNITLTATFSSDSSKKQYSTDNTTWKTYSSAVAVAANGTYYFRGIDAAGNISSVAAYKVTNIDKTAPAAPTAKADITKVTNQNVTLTAAYSADTVTKQYSLDNSTWKTYSSGVTMKKNGTAYFRGIDAAGNISNVAYLKVKNIDKTAPRKPKVTASTMDPTNQNVTLTAAYSADTVTKQYSLDNSKWKSYKAAGVTLKENGVVYFRGIDEAGNISVVKRRKVKNIDKVAPAKPTLASVSTTAMTNGSVTVKADFSSDSSKKQYSLDNETWKSYKSAGVTLKSNGTVYFRSIDAAGNISKVASQKVSNICPKGDFTNDTLEAAGEKKALKLSSAQKITGWVGLGDPKDFIKLEVQKKGNVSLDMNAATAKAQKNGEIKLSLLNSAGKAVALSALDSDTLATKSKLAAGIYYLGISCTDVKKYSTSYTVTAGMLAS